MSENTCVINMDKKTDLLNRKEFVKRFINIADILAQSQKSVCYAINGSWGSGKSFVLDMIEGKTEKNGELSEFLVFRYNCWEYDYYAEPLSAIVASILDGIDKRMNIFSAETRRKFVEIIKVASRGIWNKGKQKIEEKTGLDIDKVTEILSTGSQAAESRLKEEHEFDQYYPLKKALNMLRDEVRTLSTQHPVMFIVDELDRCLPEYAIKVLERLHHIFYSIPNVQVVLSIDKQQLAYTVEQIFGAETNVDKYLEKFLAFELKLPEGSFENVESFEERFKDYLKQFYYSNEEEQFEVNEFKNKIFAGLDIRTRIAIIEKCLLLHELMKKDDQQVDFSFMCIEVLLTIIKYVNVDTSREYSRFSHTSIFISERNEYPTEGLRYLSEKYKKNNVERKSYQYYSTDNHIRYIYADDIWGKLLAAYRYVLGFEEDRYLFYATEDGYKIKQFTKDYWTLLQSIH